jgi:hypothetical protein
MILFLTCLVVVVVVMGGGEYHALEGIIIYFCCRNFIWDIKKLRTKETKKSNGILLFSYCFCLAGCRSVSSAVHVCRPVLKGQLHNILHF